MLFFFFFNDTATTEIYTLSLHDALPISVRTGAGGAVPLAAPARGEEPPGRARGHHRQPGAVRSEEHTSELQSRLHLVCRLLLEKKKNNTDDVARGQPKRDFVLVCRLTLGRC